VRELSGLFIEFETDILCPQVYAYLKHGYLRKNLLDKIFQMLIVLLNKIHIYTEIWKIKVWIKIK